MFILRYIYVENRGLNECLILSKIIFYASYIQMNKLYFRIIPKVIKLTKNIHVVNIMR